MLGLDSHVLEHCCVRAGGPARTQAEAARTPIDSGRPLFVPRTVLLEPERVRRGVRGHPAGGVCRDFDHLPPPLQAEADKRSTVESALGGLKHALDFAGALHHVASRCAEAFACFDGKGFAGKARRLAPPPPVRLLAGAGRRTPHSITPSARSSTAPGIVSPMARAVFRLTTSSTWVGSSTGRSAGFAPLAIRSTKAARRRCTSSMTGP